MEGLVFLVFLALIIFWIYQLVQVVSMDDKEFKGRNDKLIFFMIVFFGLIPGAIGFYLWRHFRAIKSAVNRQPDAHLEAAFMQFMKEHQKELNQGDSAK